MSGPWRLLRAGGRLLRLAAVFVGAAAELLVAVGPRADLRRRAQWLSRWSGRALRVLQVRVHVRGRAPCEGAVVSNHLGYLDILVFSAVNEQASFLAKAEVRRWPVIGRFAAWSGARFIERRRRRDLPRQHQMLREIVAHAVVPTLFLEGTSTDGAGVLPFHPALLEPAVGAGWLLTPAAIRFSAEGGDPATCVCWWGDMTFLGHLLRLARLDSVTAYLIFGPPLAAHGDRKLLARRLRDEVLALRTEIGCPAPCP